MSKMHPKLVKALEKLTELQRDCGELPPGFLYCGCKNGPYEGVIRFFGWDPKQASGVCDDCEKKVFITKSGEYVRVLEDRNLFARYEFVCKAPDLYDHVRIDVVRKFWAEENNVRTA